MGVVSENISKAILSWRNTNKPEDWDTVGVIDDEEVLFQTLDLRGSRFNFKLTDTQDSGQIKIKSLEFPAGIIVYTGQ